MHKTIKSLPQHERPREKLATRGAENLTDKELLAILLRTGRAGKSALDIAAGLLEKFPKKRILDASVEELRSVAGIDIGKAATIAAAFELTKRALGVHSNARPVLESPDQVLAQLYDIRVHKKEHLVALYLNARNELVHREEISVGIADASLVHPREVFAPALEHSATAVIIAHNHPSGSPEPSAADLEVTRNLYQAGKMMDIRLLDHVVVTKESWKSILGASIHGRD